MLFANIEHSADPWIVVGTVCAIVMALGLMASGVWILAMMKADLRHVIVKVDSLTVKIDGHANTCDVHRSELEGRVDGVEDQLRLEGA
jgi:hypothetical protein